MWPGPDHPYQDLPALPPDQPIETPRTLKTLVGASRALAALDMACRRLPDPTLLINTVPLMEAQASSEIENIVTTNDELFRAAGNAASTVTPATKEALRYRAALREGQRSLADRPLTAHTAVTVCSVLMGVEQRVRDQPGTFIGNPSSSTRIYSPPEGRDVIWAKLSAWERFLHSHDDLDPLVVMALLHYQFEAIHPFFDGNGRTGRVLNLLFLVHSGLLAQPVLYLSSYLMQHRNMYHAGLLGVTANAAWEDWLCFMLGAVEHTSRTTLNLVDTITAHREDVELRIRREIPGLPAVELSRLMTAQPYVRIESLVNAELAQRQTAARWLNAIVDVGLLQSEKVGRSKIFINSALLDIIATASSLPARQA